MVHLEITRTKHAINLQGILSDRLTESFPNLPKTNKREKYITYFGR